MSRVPFSLSNPCDRGGKQALFVTSRYEHLAISGLNRIEQGEGKGEEGGEKGGEATAANTYCVAIIAEGRAREEGGKKKARHSWGSPGETGA